MDGNINSLFEKMIQGDRVALGKAMTLVESERAEDRNRAIDLLILCERKLRVHDPSIRFAISGAPGVGKSSLIEALGLKAISKGYTVGVINQLIRIYQVKSCRVCFRWHGAQKL